MRSRVFILTGLLLTGLVFRGHPMRGVSVGTYLKRWHSPEHLKTQEERRLFLEACFEEDPGDGSLIQACIRDICLSWGEVLPDGPIEISTATRIIKILGMELRVISPA